MTIPLSRLPRLLPLPDVATALRVSVKTVRRWITQGELRIHTLGRQLRVSEEDLAAFITKRRS